MTPLYLITQYGHPHCVKTPKASGTRKRPSCFLHLSPCFSLQDWSGGRKALSRTLWAFCSDISSDLTSLVLFTSWGVFCIIDEIISSLQYTDYPFWWLSFLILPMYIYFGLQILFLEDALALCMRLHFERERWSGPFPQHRCPWRGGRKTQGVGFFHNGRS